MTWTSRGPARIVGVGLIAAAAIVAGCTPQTTANRAPVDVRGSDPNAGAQRAGQNTLNNDVVAGADQNGVVTYDGYQSALAQPGDTVSTVAGRVGLSASELGAYNGLPVTHQLQDGDELVLPPRPGGYGDGGQQVSISAPNQVPATQTPAVTNPVPQTPTIQQAPLDSGTAVNPDGTLGSIEAPSLDPTQAATDAATTQVADAAATSVAPPNAPTPEAWSPDLAAAAIERSSGINEDGTLGAPPSASDPVPPEPTARGDLASPDLSQYQTNEAPEPAARTQPPIGTDAQDGTQVAAATPQQIKLRRPVDGPIAIGFNKGSGPARNDGVDFAAAAGSPVVAAADGEVALVSQSLGGLGTIVLVRHPNELLTVYGRIDGVLVNKGDVVASGQQIGIVSDAASPAEPRMHFEVRRGAESLDPTLFL